MTTWDDRYREGAYPDDPDPSRLLRENVDWFPGGRALDIAAGSGRNAVFLAERGYDVVGVDKSRAGLDLAARNAAERGVDVDLVRADLDSFVYPESTFDVITISFYRAVDRLPDVKGALKPGGVLFYEHHLRTTDPVEAGPPTDRYRFGSNELLRSCLDLTVLRYEERTRERDGGRAAVAGLVARKTAGDTQSYPR